MQFIVGGILVDVNNQITFWCQLQVFLLYLVMTIALVEVAESLA